MLRLGENEFGKEEKMGKKEMMRTRGRGEYLSLREQDSYNVC